jgi:hypothetical protein
VIPEVFEVIDWPKIFGVSATPLAEAGPANDDELLAVQPFGFAPSPAVSWRIGCVDRLGDHALETELAGVP